MHHKQLNQAIIGIGSNIHPVKNIATAMKKIEAGHRIIKKSRFVETEPIWYLKQPDFVNGVIMIETDLRQDQLKAWLLDTEKAMGRIRGENKYGPRSIDLDIVVWNGVIVDDDIYERQFLRDAVLEVYPNLTL